MEKHQKQSEKPQAEKPHTPKPAYHAPAEEVRYLVRVYNTDLDGKKNISKSLQKITGVGESFSNAILTLAKVTATKKTGTLTDAEIKRIEDVMQNTQKYDLPAWMLNRRSDPETGDDKHLFQSDLKYQVSNDIKLMQKIRTYKGVRHMSGLTVRGQKTKANFRRNKGKGLGVKKKADVAAASKKK